MPSFRRTLNIFIFCFTFFALLFLFACQKAPSNNTRPLGESTGVLNGNGTNCSGITINGNFLKDTQVNTTHSVDIILNISSPGSYDIHTDTVNGLYFKKTGSFSSAGQNKVTLPAFGKPLSKGSNVFHVNYANSTCSFIININETPALEDSTTVFFGSLDGYLYAVQGFSGKLKWRCPMGGTMANATLVDSLIYVGSKDHNLYAIHVRTGALQWKFYTGAWPMGDVIEQSIMSENGVVYFSCVNGKTYAIDTTLTSNGIGRAKVKWVFTSGLGGATPSAPAVKNNMAFFGTDTTFYALDAQTGTLKWKYFPQDNCDFANPSVVNNVVYMATSRNNIYAFNPQTGAVIWKCKAGGNSSGYHSSPTVVNNILYVATDSSSFANNNICAIDVTTGKILWTTRKQDLGNTTNSSPIVANGMVYCGSENGSLYAWSAATGEFKWKYTTNGAISSSPVAVNDIVYATSQDGSLYAISSTGQLKWKFTSGAIIYGSPFVTSSSGHKYSPSNSGDQD
jgi:eukaryotic-like serine/threonine-protein kinase